MLAYTRINGLAFKVSSVHIDCSAPLSDFIPVLLGFSINWILTLDSGCMLSMRYLFVDKIQSQACRICGRKYCIFLDKHGDVAIYAIAQQRGRGRGAFAAADRGVLRGTQGGGLRGTRGGLLKGARGARGMMRVGGLLRGGTASNRPVTGTPQDALANISVPRGESE